MIKSNSVICYLANRGVRNYYDLTKSLFLLKINFLNFFNHDVIIFHESNFNSLIRRAISVFFDVKFIEIDLNSYYNSNREKIQIDNELANFGIGYRSMCYFFFSDFAKYLKAYGYKYYCRLDTDSFITKKVPFDFFKSMEVDGYRYGYIAEILESSVAVKGINSFLINNGKYKTLMEDNQFVFHDSKYNLRCIYTNFEVLDLSIFEDKSINDFVDLIVKSNNIFNFRWGDAPLRTIMISLFLDKNQIVRFTKIDYRHQLFVQKQGKINDSNPVIQAFNQNPIGVLK